MNYPLTYPSNKIISEFYDSICINKCGFIRSYCIFMKNHMIQYANSGTTYVKTSSTFLEYETIYFSIMPAGTKMYLNKIYPRIERIKGLNSLLEH